jgi:hypothetical protein
MAKRKKLRTICTIQARVVFSGNRVDCQLITDRIALIWSPFSCVFVEDNRPSLWARQAICSLAYAQLVKKLNLFRCQWG